MSDILSDERVSFDYDRSIATREGSNVANYMLRELMVAAGKPIVARGDTPQAVWRETLEDVAALRSRLAEVEADRDRWHAAYEEEVEVGGARLAEAVELLRRIGQAITDEGPMPEYHHRIMLRHRDEWPTLWAAIDAARVFIEEQGQ